MHQQNKSTEVQDWIPSFYEYQAYLKYLFNLISEKEVDASKQEALKDVQRQADIIAQAAALFDEQQDDNEEEEEKAPPRTKPIVVQVSGERIKNEAVGEALREAMRESINAKYEPLRKAPIAKSGLKLVYKWLCSLTH